MKIVSQPRLEMRVTFEVDETEAKALEAMAGYGTDAFIAAFYEKLGRACMESHEAGLRSFLDGINQVVRPALAMISNARIALIDKRNACEACEGSGKVAVYNPGRSVVYETCHVCNNKKGG